MTSITVSGLGSGLAYDSWISALVAAKQTDIDAVSSQVTKIKSQESTLNQVESTYTSLKSALEKFTKALDHDNVFKQKAVTSSSSAVTATVSAYADAQNVSVTVSQLATATVATTAATTSAAYVNGSTKMSAVSAGAFKDGTFSVYVGGVKSSISITADQSLQDVVTSLNGISGVNASLSADGKLTIGASGASAVTVGSSADTSNFGKVMSLVANTANGVTTYSSSKSVFSTNPNATLTSSAFAAGTVTEGKFTIGSAEFTIDSSTTLNSLIKKINNDADAGVVATWDANAGKLLLTAKDEGAVNINIESGTSNFTDIMGFTSGGNIADGSQKLGTNAVLSINGTTITSATNTVTSDISGITGLTLQLNDKTTSTANVAVTVDTSSAVSAVKSLVDAFNTAIAATDAATTTDGELHGETNLNSLRNSVRTIATAAVTGSDGYKTLASIGVTSGVIGTDVKANTNKLVIDEKALTTALTDNPDAVKKLLLGETTTVNGTTTTTDGVLTKLQTVVNNSTNVINGYFVKRESSYEDQVTHLNDKITRMNSDLKAYQKTLETKFSAMDTLISNLKNQASVFDSYFNKSSSSSSSSSSS